MAKKRRETQMREDTSAGHVNCPGVKVAGASAPNMTITASDMHWIEFACPTCGAAFKVFRNRGPIR